MALARLDRDARELLVSRALRTFGSGYLAAALGLYLPLPGLNGVQITHGGAARAEADRPTG